MPLEFTPPFSPNPSEINQPAVPNVPVPAMPVGVSGASLQLWQTVEGLPATLFSTGDVLSKSQSPISQWQQTTNVALYNQPLSQASYKFATPEIETLNPANQWLSAATVATTTSTVNGKTSTQKLLALYKASAPKATQKDEKLVVGGQGNFSSIEKGGTGGLFSSSSEGEEE